MNTKIQLPKFNYRDCDLYKEDRIDGLVPVKRKSKNKNKIAVRRIAEFFRREFRYDFVQFSEDDQDEDYAYLVVENFFLSEEVIGALCFRWREWEDTPASWSLQWIWLHPYFRNQGLLKKYWPQLRKKFGDFHVEGPLSPAMKGFLDKYDNLTKVF